MSLFRRLFGLRKREWVLMHNGDAVLCPVVRLNDGTVLAKSLGVYEQVGHEKSRAIKILGAEIIQRRRS